MKLLLIAALAVLATAYADGVVEEEEHDYMFFPDGDGVPHLIDLKAKPELDDDITRNVNTITFNLYTRNNPTNPQVLTLNSINTVTSSNFRNTRPTRFITHGWRSSKSSNACVVIRDAYLSTGDYNVIVVDWSSIASGLYTTSSGQVKNVGNHVGSFLKFMRQSAGLNFATTMVIGHSLGGHVAGIAAHSSGGTIEAVVGLDPALPGFNSAGSGSGIHPNDAAHVQIIHTNGGLLGLSRTAGHSDFYPNGGSSQPGCGMDLTGACSHSRAYYYFAESIHNPTGFRATVSRSPLLSAFVDRANVYMGGRSLVKSARGKYTLKTNSRSPYAQG